MSVASIGVSEVARWVARLRRARVGEGAIRNQHTVQRWDKFVGDKVVVDGQIIVSTDADGVRAPRLKPTKTGSRRVVTPTWSG